MSELQEPSQEQLYAGFQRDAFLDRLRYFIDKATGTDSVLVRVRSDSIRLDQEGRDARTPEYKFPPRWSTVPAACENDWKDPESFSFSVARMVRLVIALSAPDRFAVGSVSPSKICDEVDAFLARFNDGKKDDE